MTNFVTVAADNGRHVSLPEGYAKSRGLEILEEAAVDHRGRPLPERDPSDAQPDVASTDGETETAWPSDTNPSGSASAAWNQKETP